jgi:hypothetical protein
MRNFKQSSKWLAAAAVTVIAASGFSRTISFGAAPADDNQLTAEEKKAGWALLFDGKSLAGWHGYKQPDSAKTRWKVEDGLLTLDPGDGKDTRGALDIVTSATYDRFDLRWDWRISEGGNSGVKYFVLEDMDSAIGHEYQVIDDERHADAKIGPHRQTAAFYDVLQAANRPMRPAGQWNQSRVVSNGTTIEHWLNGTRVLQYELDSPALRAAIAKSKFKDVARFGKLQNAHILLQDHGNRVWYRNLKIRRLPGGQTGTQNAPNAQGGSAARGVQVVANEGGRRVDVTIDGQAFTSYIYPDTLKKPVLFPIRSSKSTLVTRGYPLEPRAFERVDHPHHVGLWFNHGDVNGLDFWNNSDAIPADRAPKMGTIRHKRVVEAKSGADRGELVVEMEWLQPDDVALLTESARYVFSGSGDTRTVDRITTLTAINKPVVFRDNKEGALGLRVSRELEQPAPKPELITDANGKPMDKPFLHNDGITGQYTSSEGLKGDAVWGTRGRWCMLGGTIGTQPVTIAILDHPSNPNGPTYWHARGYGLFSANVFGRQVFDPKQEELVLTLEPGKSVTFRHRILILDAAATPESIEREYRTFSAPTATSK